MAKINAGRAFSSVVREQRSMNVGRGGNAGSSGNVGGFVKKNLLPPSIPDFTVTEGAYNAVYNVSNYESGSDLTVHVEGDTYIESSSSFTITGLYSETTYTTSMSASNSSGSSAVSPESTFGTLQGDPSETRLMLNLDSADDSYLTLDSPITLPDAFEIKCEFRKAVADEVFVFAANATGTNAFYINATGDFVGRYGTSNSFKYLASSLPLDTDAHTLRIVRYDDTNLPIKLFLDDVEIADDTFNVAFTVGQLLRYSSNYNSGSMWDYEIYDGDSTAGGVLIHKWALDTAGDVATEAAEVGGIALTKVGMSASSTIEMNKYVREFDTQAYWESTDETLTFDQGQYQAPPDIPYTIVPLITQSNMVGKGTRVAGIDDDYTGLEAVKQFGYNSLLVKNFSVPLEFNAVYGTMGAYHKFAQQAVANSRFTKPIMFVPVAVSGTSFSTDDWNPGNTVYEKALNRINAAMATHVDNELGCVLMMGGEGDGYRDSTTFQADMEAMYQDLVSRASGMTTSTPLIMSHIKSAPDYNAAGYAVVNDAIDAFAAVHSNVATVAVDDLTIQDETHFDNVSLRTIGERMDAALGSLLA